MSYETWPRPIDFCATPPISGLQEMRHEALIDIDKQALQERMEAYYDPEVEWEELKSFKTGLTQDAGGFKAKSARSKLQKQEKFQPERLRRYALYPLDSRWCYWTRTTPLWNRPRPNLAVQQWTGNSFFIVRMFAERPHAHAPAILTSLLPDYHLLRPNAVAIPFRIRHIEEGDDGHHGKIRAREDVPTTVPAANLSQQARAYLKQLGISDPNDDAQSASLIWLHALAIAYSPFYLRENADGVRRDWPRIPLPVPRDALVASAALGAELTAFLNTEASVKGVTANPVRVELRAIGNVSVADGKALDTVKDLKIEAGWGHAGKEAVTMPGKGKSVERDYTEEEREAISKGAAALGLTLHQALGQLGEKTYDVYLNERAYWKNIPNKVWDYTIGGYQVIKSG